MSLGEGNHIQVVLEAFDNTLKGNVINEMNAMGHLNKAHK
jgi:hypothetical protein